MNHDVLRKAITGTEDYHEVLREAVRDGLGQLAGYIPSVMNEPIIVPRFKRLHRNDFEIWRDDSIDEVIGIITYVVVEAHLCAKLLQE